MDTFSKVYRVAWCRYKDSIVGSYRFPISIGFYSETYRFPMDIPWISIVFFSETWDISSPGSPAETGTTEGCRARRRGGSGPGSHGGFSIFSLPSGKLT